ncbi:phospho-N-acetylmuramoyl-pentapeptide-transferase [Spirochaeta africana]|uniref:Phospho-N-acetylmuramoyl-pentapeptide-transferase n=1 Tax=Spirochaeta africana (strain ATCC 700263 / DSM 8902 / Z-7692) TaxID=889378 RepID=H9UKX5_SPIAZ|nr:phospho-N-acetylmuramoyl-pentapeptide-transferase [Spirochaeta africana]AFG38168.1 phospho-N-acetylmuramoyl-pentapeptide-transferase [Spirochaeta africana DSM 8902]
MLKEFLFPLTEYFSPFNIFQYITFRAAYGAVTSLLISFLFGPKVIEMLRRLKFGEEIRSDGPQTHQVKSGTPTMGGVLMIVSMVLAILLWMDVRSPFTWIGLVSIVGFGTIGFIDDFRKIRHKNSDGLSASVKLLAQVAVAGTVAFLLYAGGREEATLLYIPMVKQPVLDLGLLYIPFGIFWLVGFSNAVNLTDGLDGLATGLVILVALTFGLFAYVAGRVDFSQYLQIPYVQGAGELAILCMAVVGACVGFLWFNGHPAEVMMGDTGSLALGGILATVAMMIKHELLLVIVGGVFVLETLSVIIQVSGYKLTGKRVFKMAPLHHHFELEGWAESKVVLRFWILGGLFAILSLSTLKIR